MNCILFFFWFSVLLTSNMNELIHTYNPLWSEYCYYLYFSDEGMEAETLNDQPEVTEQFVSRIQVLGQALLLRTIPGSLRIHPKLKDKVLLDECHISFHL